MQTTLRRPVKMIGTGLHSGRPARLVLRPASAEQGIWFKRVDVTDKDNLIQAIYDNVSDTMLCTRLSNSAGVSVSTVEHLMAAIAGCGLHNVMIELDGPEVPIMDGSSVAFVREIMAAGLRELDADVRAFRVLKTVTLEEDGYRVSVSPSDGFEIDFAIDFDAPAIGAQHRALNMANGSFVRELSDCRTFCLRSEVEALQANGLGLGGSLMNAVIIDGDFVLNENGFRRPDECVRHKMLDALGDLALAGAPILGRYEGNRAGHRATNRLLHALFSTPGAVEIVTCDAQMARNLPGAAIGLSDLARVG